MIIVTGGAGFIGSCIVKALNERGRDDILIVDALGNDSKWTNLRNLAYWDYIDRNALLETLDSYREAEGIIHMGACSATTETDAHYLMENNYRYTLRLARFCMDRGLRFVYASSAATYGLGSSVCKDDESAIHELEPLNIYGYSKQAFDLKARREDWFSTIVGLKYFNVYGPNEYHKGEMSSVVFKAFNQIREGNTVRLFKSYKDGVEDGQQMRDFMYVKDAVDATLHLYENKSAAGLYNIGCGTARSFKDLAEATFAAMGLSPEIVYIDMPEALRDRYQYYTQADVSKLRAAGFTKPFPTLEEGIEDYVKNYLLHGYKNR